MQGAWPQLFPAVPCQRLSERFVTCRMNLLLWQLPALTQALGWPVGALEGLLGPSGDLPAAPYRGCRGCDRQHSPPAGKPQDAWDEGAFSVPSPQCDPCSCAGVARGRGGEAAACLATISPAEGAHG